MGHCFCLRNVNVFITLILSFYFHVERMSYLWVSSVPFSTLFPHHEQNLKQWPRDLQWQGHWESSAELASGEAPFLGRVSRHRASRKSLLQAQVGVALLTSSCRWGCHRALVSARLTPCPRPQGVDHTPGTFSSPVLAASPALPQSQAEQSCKHSRYSHTVSSWQNLLTHLSPTAAYLQTQGQECVQACPMRKGTHFLGWLVWFPFQDLDDGTNWN